MRDRFYYFFWRSNDVWDQKNHVFMLYMWKWVVNPDIQEPYQWILWWRVHTMTMREICARIVLRQRFAESITECDQRENIGSKCYTQTSKFVKWKMCIVNQSHHLCPMPYLTLKRVWTKSYGSNGSDGVQLYRLWHVLIFAVPVFSREYCFVIRCSKCSIMCEVWASTFPPCHVTLDRDRGRV